jgi:predicted nuclease with TOPRIM domain
MSNQISTTIIMCIIFGFFSFYYFNKFQESESEYLKLHRRFDQITFENQKLKSRIKDLQSYKNDVSKTMQILDNELMVINNHIQKQNTEYMPQESTLGTLPTSVDYGRGTLPTSVDYGRGTLPTNISDIRGTRSSPYLRSNLRSNTSRNNISLLSPELLSSLFNNMNQEIREPSLEETLDSIKERQDKNEDKNEDKNGGNIQDNIENINDINEENINDINEENINDINENVINISYDITYNPNQSNYEQFLINKQM